MPAEIRKIDPTVDCVFKRLLGSEQHKTLTLSFLNAVLDLEGKRRLVEIHFVNTYLEKNHLEEKVPIVDILVRDHLKNLFQIEIQNQIDRFFEPRAFYGWTKSNAGLLEEGEPYSALKHGISIWLLSECAFKPAQTKASSLRFRLHCPEEGLDLWPDSYLVVIQLPNWRETAKMNPEKAMWLRFFREAKNVDPNSPPNWLQHPTMKEALNVLQEFANDVDAYLGYLSLEKARREHWMHTTYLDQTVEELSATKAELGETRAQLGESRAQLGEARAQLDEARAQLDEARAQLGEARAQLGEARAQLGETKVQLGEFTAQLGETKAQLGETKAQLGDTTAQLGETKAQLGETKAQLGDTTAQLGETKTQLGETTAQLGETKAQLAAALKTIEDLSRRMSALESHRDS